METSNNSANNGSNNDSNDKPSNDSKDNGKGSDEPTKTKNESPTPVNNICRICMNEILHRSLTDTCRHEFCFNCLYRWSRQHSVCPFCRQLFRNIVCNIRHDNDFDQIPIDVQIGNVAPNNVRTADEALYNNNEVLLQQYSILRNLAVAQLAQLHSQLTNLDPDSYQSLDIQQRIANAEQRRDHATAMIDQMFANMVRLNANLIRAPRNPLPTGSRLAPSGYFRGPRHSVAAITNNRSLGPIQENVTQLTVSVTSASPPALISPTEAIAASPPVLSLSPTETYVASSPVLRLSPTETIASVSSATPEEDVINDVINVPNQNQLPIPLNSGRNEENSTNSSQTSNLSTESLQNITNNNPNAVHTANSFSIAPCSRPLVDSVQQVAQAIDNTGSNVSIGPNRQELSQTINVQELNANSRHIVETQAVNVENHNQIPVSLNAGENNGSHTENVETIQRVDTNQNNANNNNTINDANSTNTDTNNTIATTNLQNVDNIEAPLNPTPDQNTATIIANENEAQTAINAINVGAVNDNNSGHNTIVHSDGKAGNSKQHQQQQQQNQPRNGN